MSCPLRRGPSGKARVPSRRSNDAWVALSLGDASRIEDASGARVTFEEREYAGGRLAAFLATV